MGIFGWSYPPGCSGPPEDEYPEQPCPMCAQNVDKCECPECPECGDVGNPSCYMGDKKHAEWPDRGDKVSCLADFLMQRFGAIETPHYAGRCLYKYVDCGPWTVFLVHGIEATDDRPWVPDGVYYEDKEAGDYIYHCYGIKVGSIVEGSDVEVGPFEMVFPFSMEKFWKAVDEINEEAKFYWERDNSQWFLVISPKGKEYYGHETWGDITWDCHPKPRFHKEIEKDIFAFLEEGDLKCYGDGSKTDPLSRKGWSIRGWINDTTF